MEWIVVKTLLSLAAVIALMIGVVFVMKKFTYGAQGASSAVIDMKVIGTMMLQPKRSVSLLKVMNKVLIVGITEDGMRTLGEISDAESLQHIEEKLAAQPARRRFGLGEPASAKWFAKRTEDGAQSSFAEALALQFNKLTAKGQ
jgi:flagellar biogenesis protein FliO